MCSSVKTFWSETLSYIEVKLLAISLAYLCKLYLRSPVPALFFSRASFSFLQKRKLRAVIIHLCCYWRENSGRLFLSCTLDLSLSSSKGWGKVCHYLVEYVKCLSSTCKIDLFPKKHYITLPTVDASTLLWENCSWFYGEQTLARLLWELQFCY